MRNGSDGLEVEMWRRVEVKNYRSIEHVEVELAPFTVLVGPNGSGKSNFADALVFARDLAIDGSTAVQNHGGIKSIRRWRPKGATDVAADLRVAATRVGLATSYARHQFSLKSGQEGVWRISRELIEVFRDRVPELSIERDSKGVTGYSSVKGGPRAPILANKLPETLSAMVHARRLNPSLIRMGRVRRFRLNPDEMRRPQLVTERVDLDESGSNIAVAVQQLRKRTPQWEGVMAAMARIVPGLTDVDVDATLGRYLVLTFRQGQADGAADFVAADMSEGAIRALGILVAASQMTPEQLLIIEEPEVSIHPGAAQVLFEVLKEASQIGSVLITTHSAELLDAAKDEEILVCDYRDGITEIGQLEEAQRELVKRGLFSVAELMRSEPLRIEGAPPRTIDPSQVVP